MKIKQSLGLLALVAVLALLAGCGVKRSQASYDFKSKLLSSNYDGTYVIRTQVRARNAAIAFTDAQRKVVREVIFDGVDAGSNGVEPLKPILFDMNAKYKYEAYFEAFFRDGGEWTKYANLMDKRTGTTTYQRNGLQSIETVTVTVNRSALKDKLIMDGILEQ